MRQFPLLAPARLGIATAEEMWSSGWTESATRHAVRAGDLERVAAGRYALPPPTSLNRHQRADLALARRAVAATLLGDRIAVGHLAGAWVRGWPIWASRPEPCVTTRDRRVCRLTGVHLHRVDPDEPMTRMSGLLLTPRARTLVDIAREFGTEAALVSGDAALRRGHVTREDVVRACDAASGQRGIESARGLADLLDPLAESPLESRCRHRCHVHGVPPTHSQVKIYARRTGVFLGRVDHFWDEGVVGEADGRLKYEDDPEALSKEKWRQQGFEDVELEVVRFGGADLRDFTEAERRIRRGRARARRKLADGPPMWIATTLDGVRIPVPDTP